MKFFARRAVGLWLATLLQFVVQVPIFHTLAHHSRREIVDSAQQVFLCMYSTSVANNNSSRLSNDSEVTKNCLVQLKNVSGTSRNHMATTPINPSTRPPEKN